VRLPLTQDVRFRPNITEENPLLHGISRVDTLFNYKPGAAYFFTVVTYRRRPILCDDRVPTTLRDAVITVQSRYPFTIIMNPLSGMAVFHISPRCCAGRLPVGLGWDA